ncbi:hypothetical protein [Marinicellulosiphila megalodicopiae]|uniref:hypothetical protein n=1 Tax=Marinicellulosiphila megalodicopiae TaxID=2724896 RepID=UPI003BB11A4E
MKDVILCVSSEYTHTKLEALTLLMKNVQHIHVFGEQCERWKQMIECCLNITVISYPGSPVTDVQQSDQVICI